MTEPNANDTSPDAFIAMVENSCQELTSAFKTLADNAAPALRELDSTINRVQVWRYECADADGGPPTVVYSQSEWSGIRKFFSGVTSESFGDPEDGPHQRARLVAALGESASNNANYQLDTNDIVNSVQNLCNFMVGWMRIRHQFTSNVSAAIPDSASDIPSAGSLVGWDGVAAAQAYADSVPQQSGSANAAVGLMNALISNTADYLSTLTSSLASLSAITLELNTEYTGLLSKGTEFVTAFAKPSWDSIVGAIDTVTSLINSTNERQVAAATTLGELATNSISTVLKISELQNEIINMGAKGKPGWAEPKALNTDGVDWEDGEQELSVSARYLADHAQFWQVISNELKVSAEAASSVEKLDVFFVRIPDFQANQMTVLNKLSSDIAELILAQGAAYTQTLSDKLLLTMRAYLEQESENVAEAAAIERAVLPSATPMARE